MIHILIVRSFSFVRLNRQVKSKIHYTSMKSHTNKQNVKYKTAQLLLYERYVRSVQICTFTNRARNCNDCPVVSLGHFNGHNYAWRGHDPAIVGHGRGDDYHDGGGDDDDDEGPPPLGSFAREIIWI